MKKLLFVGSFVTCSFVALNASAALDAKCYIMDGIVHQWDGLENNGYGQHSDSITTWKDLRGTSKSAFPLPTGATVLADSIRTTRAYGVPTTAKEGSFVGYETPMMQCFVDGRYTFEFAYNLEQHSYKSSTGYKNAAIKFAMIGAGGHWFGLWPEKNLVGFNHNGANGSDGGYEEGLNGICYTVADTNDMLGAHTMSCSQDLKTMNLTYDDHIVNYTTTAATVPRSTCGTSYKLAFNRTYWFNVGMDGKYYAMRMYSRKLTPEEVYLNSTVDRIRYMGASKTEYDNSKMPTGYRFVNESEDVFLEKVVSISGTHGKVAADDAGAAYQTNFWCKVSNNAVTATLSATPDAGYEFAYWQSGVVLEDATTASGTVRLTGEDIVAKFRRTVTNGMTDGLVYEMNLSKDSASGVYNSVKKTEVATIGKAYTGTDTEHVPAMPMVKISDVHRTLDADKNTTVQRPVLYLPQPSYTNANNKIMTVRQSVHLADRCVDSDEQTVRVRFRYPEAVNSSCNNTPVPLFMNGLDSANNLGWGFGLYNIKDRPTQSLISLCFGSRTITHGGGSDEGQTRTSFSLKGGIWYDMVVSVKRIGDGRTQYRIMVGYNSSSGLKDCWSNTFTVSNDCLRAASSLRSMWLGSDVATDGGDADWKATTMTDLANTKIFRGEIAELHVWDRWLDEIEVRSLFGEQWTGDEWTIGALNASADEFAADSDEDLVSGAFDAKEMAWRQFPKALTASAPSVSITYTPNYPALINTNMVKYLVVEPVVGEGLPADTRLKIEVNNKLAGYMDVGNASDRAHGIPARFMNRDSNGKITIKLTREGSCSEDLLIDRIALTGSWQVGTGSWLELGSQWNGVNVYAIGNTNKTHAANGAMKNGSCPYAGFAFNIPEAMTGIGFTYSGTVGRNFVYSESATHAGQKTDAPVPFGVYVNGNKVYTAENGIAAGKSFSVQVDPQYLKPGLNLLKIVNEETNEFLQEHYGVNVNGSDYIHFSKHKVEYPAVSTGLGFFILFK